MNKVNNILDFYQFKIIALKVGETTGVGVRKLKTNKFYYFYQGYDISEDGQNISIEKNIIIPKELYNEHLFIKNKDENNVAISISAIVGQNGSGKSTIIEFVIRLLNNFSASLIGEYEVNPKAHRLIYINNLEGQLYYCWKDEYYVLSIKDRQVVLSKFYKTDNEYIYIKSSEHIYNNEQKKDSKFRQHKDLEAILKNNFFYTLVSNYSLYAYNTQDYKFENKVDNKLLESDCWLKGIFHKNDGYQTPLVLTPYREDGCIDINKENRLSKDRLISAMIMPKSEYRIINGHLEAYSFSLLNKERCINAKYLKQKVGFKNLYERGFEALKDMIIEQWEECIKIKFKDYEYRKHYNEALQYIVYKTLKISSTYKVYIAFFQANKDIAYKIKDYEKLKELVYNLSIDTSHITKKIRQTISYILFGLYDNDNNIYDINKLSNKASDYIEIANEKYSLDGKAYWSIDDFIPPPFFKVVINLRDIISKDKVLFETLSSGERQQAYSVSSLLYHLGNLNSAKNSPNRLAYNKVNIILEEIELYFHPELQRTLLKYIIDGIRQLYLPNIEAVNICFVTHSPFILSDIPSQSTLMLNIDEKGKTSDSIGELKTFSANIHDMLKHSFFLKNGAIGENAKSLIGSIVIAMEIIRDKGKRWNEFLEKDHYYKSFLIQFISNDKFDFAKLCQLYSKEYILKIILLIDEKIIRTTLIEEYNRTFYNVISYEKEINQRENEAEIKLLKERLYRLENDLCGN